MSELIDEQVETLQLPNDVHTAEQLSLLPQKFLADDPRRPLLLRVKCKDNLGTNHPEDGNFHPDGSDDGACITTTIYEQQFKYALRPMWYSVIFILIIEGLERLTYYGLNNTETAFLTGEYGSWSPGMSDVKASSYTSASIGIAYTAPFIGGIIADGFSGDYFGIIIGICCFYIPGLILISLTTFPGLLGPTFNVPVLSAGLLALMPIGTGFIKSIVNVFGAKQFHPTLQSASLESYYVNFYIAINVGSLIGGIVVPILCQISLEAAYLVPVCSLAVGFCIFLLASKRYVRRPPEKTALFNTLKLLGKAAMCKPFSSSTYANGGTMSESFVAGVGRLLQVIPATCLVLPFTIAYSQMTTVFILQGNAMKSMGLLDASLMANFDPIFVLVMGYVVGSLLYPTLSKREIRFPTTYKFAIGTAFGLCAMLSAIVVDHVIKATYHNHNGAQLPIIWQVFAYAFVGTGEIFCMATSYNIAFSIAPREQKGLASALNLFLTLGLANFICVGLYNVCAQWFPASSDDPTISKTELYVNGQLNNYLWVLVGISILGIVINVLPPVRNWVERLQAESLEASLVAEDHSSDDDNLSKDNDVEDKMTDSDSDEEPTSIGSQSSSTSTDENQNGNDEFEVVVVE